MLSDDEEFKYSDKIKKDIEENIRKNKIWNNEVED